MIFQLAFTFAPFMQTVFPQRAGVVRLGLIIVPTGPLLSIVLELEKWIRRCFREKHAPTDGPGAPDPCR